MKLLLKCPAKMPHRVAKIIFVEKALITAMLQIKEKVPISSKLVHLKLLVIRP